MVEELSQDEIEALLSSLAIQEEFAEPVTEPEETTSLETLDQELQELPTSKTEIPYYQKYDFNKPPKNTLNYLKTYFQPILNSWASFFTLLNRAKIELEIKEIKKVSNITNLLKEKNLQGASFNFENEKAFIALEKNLCYALITVLLGGKTSELTNFQQSNFTLIEKQLLKKIYQDLIKFFLKNWQIYTYEETLELVELIDTDKLWKNYSDLIVLEISFKGKDINSFITIILPYSKILSLKEKPLNHSPEIFTPISEEHTKLIKETISKTLVEINLELGNTDIFLYNLLNLQKGDVIKLNQTWNDPVTIIINKKPKFYAEKIITKNKISAKILNSIVN